MRRYWLSFLCWWLLRFAWWEAMRTACFRMQPAQFSDLRGALITATGLQLGSGRLRELGSGCSRELATHSWFRCSNCLRELSQPSVVRHGEPMQRFEELCDLIVIERDVEKFSTLVTELNQLDPTRRLPVISKQPPPRQTLQH